MTNLDSIIKETQKIMRKDKGIDGDAQRLGQLSWILFYKILCDQEKQFSLINNNYKKIVPLELHWDTWAKDPEGITGEELLHFIDNKIFPFFSDLDKSDNSFSHITKAIFQGSFNFMKSGILLRQLVNKINFVDFNKLKDRNTFGKIYENFLMGLQSAGNAGEFYTPRAVTNFIIKCIQPKLRQKIIDPATGTGGFLTSVINWLRDNQVKTSQDEKELKDFIFGVEKKALPYVLCMTNLLLHNIENPHNIIRDNTLEKPFVDYDDEDKVDIVVTNPPFGGSEEDGIEKNFPSGFRTRETASLFLLAIIRMLKKDGKCGIVLPDGFMSGDKVKAKIKKYLLSECNLHTVIRLPEYVFYPYTNIATNILFFDKNGTTDDIWYYEQPYPENYKYTKNQHIKDTEFDETLEWFKNKKETSLSWKVNIQTFHENNYNLDVKNPNKRIVKEESSSKEIIINLEKKLREAFKIINEIKKDINAN